MKFSDIILRLLFFIGLIPLSHTVAAQKISKTSLAKSWKLEKYYEEGEYYGPEVNEVNDYINFKEDMTFEAMMEGELYSGTWMLNTNGSYIELKYATQEVDKLRIKWFGDFSIVVIFDLDYYRYTEVHYHSCKD